MEQVSKNEIFEHFRTLGCCDVCCLRFCGESCAVSFKNLDSSFYKIGVKGSQNGSEDENEQKAKALKRSPCIACLGLFQKPVCDDILEKVIENIQKSDYDSSTFNVALSLPVSFQLRAHALWIHLAHTYPTFYATQFVSGRIFGGIKEVWKWTCTPLMESKLGKSFDPKSDLSIGVSLSYDDDATENSCLVSMLPNKFNKKRPKKLSHVEIISRKGVEEALKDIQDVDFLEHYPEIPEIPNSFVHFESVNMHHEPIFIAGRYNKWSRTLPQTPWVINGERKLETSLQELICDPIQHATKSVGYKFAASGREDVDVRTLGRGRPFSIELLNPKRTKFTSSEMHAVEILVNDTNVDKLYIRDLQVVKKDELSHLKEGEESKTKSYTAFCVAFGPYPTKLEDLNSLCPLELNQSTPVRVLHRRPVAVRKRTVYSLSSSKIKDGTSKDDPSYFKLNLNTQAGTYIKEFIHGDFGRTTPNLCELLGVPVDILALDVQEIHLDWPPEVKYDT